MSSETSSPRKRVKSVDDMIFSPTNKQSSQFKENELSASKVII